MAFASPAICYKVVSSAVASIKIIAFGTASEVRNRRSVQLAYHVNHSQLLFDETESQMDLCFSCIQHRSCNIERFHRSMRAGGFDCGLPSMS